MTSLGPTNQGSAISDQLLGPAGAWVKRVAGDGHDVATLFTGKACRDQGALSADWLQQQWCQEHCRK